MAISDPRDGLVEQLHDLFNELRVRVFHPGKDISKALRARVELVESNRLAAKHDFDELLGDLTLEIISILREFTGDEHQASPSDKDNQ